jgi:hypothetical protein
MEGDLEDFSFMEWLKFEVCDGLCWGRDESFVRRCLLGHLLMTQAS